LSPIEEAKIHYAECTDRAIAMEVRSDAILRSALVTDAHLTIGLQCLQAASSYRLAAAGFLAIIHKGRGF
jgi:hypothetical protein